jgi:hypothetical protein
MKKTRIDLVSWSSYDDNIDIDWPMVQRTIGKDRVEWFLRQSKEQCQLVVDKNLDDLKLVAEFYDRNLLIQYHLMWS